MKVISSFILYYLISLSVYSQNQPKQAETIDSLVGLIDSGKEITQLITCDTTAIWNTGYFTVYCEQFYIHKNKLVKASFQISTFPIPEKPLYNGVHFTYNAFYFHDDNLIKAIRKDSSNSVTPNDEYYFTEKNLSELDSLKLKDVKRYKQVNVFMKYGENYLRRFRENRLN